MEKILLFAFGTSWKSSLIGFGSGLIVAAAAYAQSKPEPGWYVVALALGALGRLVKDASATGAGV